MPYKNPEDARARSAARHLANHEKNNERSRTYRAENLERLRAYDKARYATDPERRKRPERYPRRRDFVNAAKDVPCAECGIRFPSVCMDFHHRDLKTKLFCVGGSKIMHSWAKVEAEIAKCDVLCANCHRLVEEAIRLAR